MGQGILFIHRWLGFISGLVVFLIAISGCIYVFQQEITHWLRKDAIYHTNDSAQPESLAALWDSTQSQVGKVNPLGWVKVYNRLGKNWVFYSFQSRQEGLTYFDQVKNYKAYYVNPVNGTIEGRYNEEFSFFNIVKMFHWSLLLRTPYGQPIVGWSTVIFVIMLITGIVLWWPRNKAARKQRFWFRWKPTTAWKRKNYDLHNILGFYITIVVLVIALTGMVWAFNWFESWVYTASAGISEKPEIKIPQSTVQREMDAEPLDSALLKTRQSYPQASRYRIMPPHDSLAPIQVTVRQKPGKYYVSHKMAYDQYNGELLFHRSHADKNFGEQVLEANYDIHVGAILGLPGKILTFLGGLVAASLPVTGFLIWSGRKAKRKRPKVAKKR